MENLIFLIDLNKNLIVCYSSILGPSHIHDRTSKSSGSRFSALPGIDDIPRPIGKSLTKFIFCDSTFRTIICSRQDSTSALSRNDNVPSKTAKASLKFIIISLFIYICKLKLNNHVTYLPSSLNTCVIGQPRGLTIRAW